MPQDLQATSARAFRMQRALSLRNETRTTALDQQTVHDPSHSTPSSLQDAELGLAVGGGLLIITLIGILIFGVRRRRQIDKDRTNHQVASPRLHEATTTREATTPTVAAQDSPSFVSSSISFGSRVSCFLQEQDDATALWHHPQVLQARVAVKDLSLEALVARGFTSEVYRGYYRDRLVAIKKPLPQWLQIRPNLVAWFARVKVLSSLSLTHPHVVTFLGVSWRSLAYVCLLTEYMARGDLRAYLKQRRQQHRSEFRRQGFGRKKLAIASQVASALTFLHAQGVVHGAVRSRNILLDEKLNAKLTGYQGSGIWPEMAQDAQNPWMSVPTQLLTASVPTSVMDKRRQERTRLDAFYSAPEVLCGHRTTAKTDVFALGLLLSELDSLSAPYGYTSSFQEHCDSGELLEKVAVGHVRVHFASSRPRHGRRGSLPSQLNLRLTAAVVRLGKACVALNAIERPSAAQVSTELHKLVQMHNPKPGRTWTHDHHCTA